MIYFCFRWVENKVVAERLLSIQPNIKAVITFLEKVPKSKQPSSNSYVVIKDAVKDLFLSAKLLFLCYVAGIVEPFLKEYQTDIPMVPFLYFDLKAVMRNFLDIVIGPAVIGACRSGKHLKEIDLSKKGNLLSLSKINLGFAVEKEINTLTKFDVVTIQQINKFKESARDFVVEMLYKLFERSSLGSTLLRCASVFDPTCHLDMTQEKVQIRWTGPLKSFSELDILSTQKCDKAMLKFKSFVGDIKSKCQVELQGLTRKVRLEKFYFEEISIQKYEEIAEVLKIVLSLSHGQASVECGFSHNNTVVQTNLSAESFISKRLIKDHMLSQIKSIYHRDNRSNDKSF